MSPTTLSQNYQTTVFFLTTFLSSSTYSALLLAAVSFPSWEELNLMKMRGAMKDRGRALRNTKSPQT